MSPAQASGVSEEWVVGSALQAAAESVPGYAGARQDQAAVPRLAGKVGSVRCVRLFDEDVHSWRQWEGRRYSRAAPRDESQVGGPGPGQARQAVARQWLAVVWEAKAAFVELATGQARQLWRADLDGKPQMTCVEMMNVHGHTVALVGCADGAARVIALPSFRPVSKLAGGHRGSILCMLPLPDARLLTGGADGSLALWDLSMMLARPGADAQPKLVVPAHKDGVTSLELYPGPIMPRVVTAGGDKTVALWEGQTLRELGRQQPNEKLATLSAVPWFHPRFPRVDCLIATRNAQVGVLGLTSKGPPSLLVDLDQVIKPPQDKPHVKVYSLAVHPLKPSLIAIGTNTGLVMLEVDPAWLPAAAVLPAAPGEARHRAVFARGRELTQLSFGFGAPDCDGQQPVEQAEQRVAVLPSDGACVLMAHPVDPLLGVLWPTTRRYQVYRTGDWRVLDEGSATAIGWDTTHPRLVALTAPPPPAAPPQMRGRGKKARAEFEVAMKAFAAAQAAVSTSIGVIIKGLEGDEMIVYNESLEHGLKEASTVFGGGLFGVGGQPQLDQAERAEGYHSDAVARRVERQALQLFRWDAHTKIGPQMPMPLKVVWDVDCEYVALIYMHSVSLFTAQPRFRLLASVALEGVSDAQWFRSQVFLVTPTSIECAFVSSSSDAVEFLTLATLAPWAPASHSYQQAEGAPSPAEVAAAARLPPPARRPAGPLMLLTIRDGAVWLADSIGVVHGVPLKHPGVLCRCLNAYGDPSAAVACAEPLDSAHADDLAAHLAGRGEPRAALGLRGVGPRTRAAIASGRLKGAGALPPSDALAIVEAAAVDVDPAGGRGSGVVVDQLEALTLGATAKVGRTGAAGIAAVAEDFLWVAALAEKQQQREVADRALAALASASPLLPSDALYATLARLATTGRVALLQEVAETLQAAASLGSVAADSRANELASAAAAAALLLGKDKGDEMLLRALRRAGAHAEAAVAARARGMDDGGALDAANDQLRASGVTMTLAAP